MKTILIPTDFSPDSRSGLREVVGLLQDTKEPLKLLLLNTYLVKQSDPSEVIRENDELKTRSKEGLEIEKQLALDLITNPNIIVDTASHMGSLSRVILQLLKKHRVTLVALSRDMESMAQILRKQKCLYLITGEHLRESV